MAWCCHWPPGVWTKWPWPELRSALGQGQSGLQSWRNARRMPRFISYDVSDNVLPVDLDNELMVQMLLDEVGTQNWIEVREALSLNAAEAVAAEGGDPAALARNIELVIPYRVAQPAAGLSAAPVSPVLSASLASSTLKASGTPALASPVVPAQLAPASTAIHATWRHRICFCPVRNGSTLKFTAASLKPMNCWRATSHP